MVDPEPPLEPDPEGTPEDMIEVTLANGNIISIAATTFWSADGKPVRRQNLLDS